MCGNDVNKKIAACLRPRFTARLRRLPLDNYKREHKYARARARLQDLRGSKICLDDTKQIISEASGVDYLSDQQWPEIKAHRYSEKASRM